MTRFERMEAACRERREASHGDCEREGCIGIGWCAYIYAKVPQTKVKPKPDSIK